MRHITIYECFSELKISNELDDCCITQEEANELEIYITKAKLKKDNISWNRNSIVFINYVGFIKLSTVSIEILPKIDISNDYEVSRKSLINMLNKSRIIDFNYSDIANLNIYNMSFNEILALIFARTLQRELVKGPYLEYINIEDNSKVLKGSLLIKDHIRNISRNSSDVFCRFEEFSIDNSLNQIFNTCTSKVIQNVVNSETIKILSHIKVIFSDVSTIDIRRKVSLDYKFTRLNSRFEKSFILAKMLIGDYSSIGNKGSDNSFAILFEMNEVYERYIANLLMINTENVNIYSQHSKYKLLKNEKTDRGIFSLKPDIVIEVEGKEKIIIDTKWKKIDNRLNRHGVKREDFYQMYAYLTKYKDAKAAILLYPNNESIKCSEDEFLESWYLDDDKSKKVRVYSIDLSSEEDSIKKLQKVMSINLI